MAVWHWSVASPGANANSDPSMNWAEGMAPSVVNDNVRAMMWELGGWRDYLSGLAVAAGGTSTAITLTTPAGYPPITDVPTPRFGQVIGCYLSVSNGSGATLSIDGGTAFPIAAPAGVLTPFTPYLFSFNGVSWYPLNLYAGLSAVVPLGGIIDYALSTSGALPPNYAWPNGQRISRSTYSALFNLLGIYYGAGDGSTTFNLPDLRGCVCAGLDNLGGGAAAGRIGVINTGAGGTITGTTLGSFGGTSTHAQAIGELPVHAHANTLSDPGHAHSYTGPLNAPGDRGALNVNIAVLSQSLTTTSVSSGITINNVNAGSSNPMAWLQPTMMMGKIMRVL